METAKTIITVIKFGTAGICATLANYLGGWDAALKVLVVMTVLDYLTGVLAAIYLKEVSSDISYKGIIKKIGIYVIVAVAYLLDQATNSGEVLRSMAIGFYIATEGISLIENWGRMDLPLPSIIKDYIATAQTSKRGWK